MRGLVVDRDLDLRQLGEEAVSEAMDARSELDRLSQRLAGELRKPTHVKVRVYVIQGHSLVPKGMGRTADPFLVFTVQGRTEGAAGKRFFLDDSVNKLTDTLAPEFYRPFELDAVIPGASASPPPPPLPAVAATGIGIASAGQAAAGESRGDRGQACAHTRARIR